MSPRIGAKVIIMYGTIKKIIVYPEKGVSGRELAEAQLIAGKGIEGDFHARGGERQLSLVLAETWEKITAQTVQGLCFSRFKENICISGIDPGLLRPGKQLGIGEVIIELTGESKHCHEECSLFKAGERCPLAGMNLFAKVIKSGIITKNDNVVLKDLFYCFVQIVLESRRV